MRVFIRSIFIIFSLFFITNCSKNFSMISSEKAYLYLKNSKAYSLLNISQAQAQSEPPQENPSPLPSPSPPPSDDEDPPPIPEPGIPAKQVFQIKNVKGEFIPKAQILIGPEENKPFNKNFIEADGKGIWEAPALWKKELPLTISAPGYIRATFMDQKPKGRTFILNLAPVTNKFILEGEAQGFKIIDFDDKIDFSLIMPVFKTSDFLNFNINMAIRPEEDKLTVFGNDIYIPKNVSLPSQKEKKFFTINLQKPKYQIYLPSPGVYKIVSLKGQFPFSSYVDGVQSKKDFIDLISLFSIQGGSLREVEIKPDSSTNSRPASKTTTYNPNISELAFVNQRTFIAPPCQKDEAFLGIPLEKIESSYFPTDLKIANSNETLKLTTAKQTKAISSKNKSKFGFTIREEKILSELLQEPLLLTVLRKKEDLKVEKTKNRSLSMALLTFIDNLNPKLLPLIEAPSAKDLHTLSMAELPAAAPAQVIPQMTYLALYQVKEEIINEDNTSVERLTPLWEVYINGWVRDIQIPYWPGETNSSLANNFEDSAIMTSRWKISYIGSSTEPKIDLGPTLLDSATHATQSSIDFK